MRLLLINPRFPESFWSYEWMLNAILPGQRSINPPLRVWPRSPHSALRIGRWRL